MDGGHSRRQTEQLLADGDLLDEPLSTSALLQGFRRVYSPSSPGARRKNSRLFTASATEIHWYKALR